MEVPLVIVIGLVAAGSIAAVLEAHGVTESKALAGAVCVGALAGLAAGDFIIDGAGDWWDNHQMFAASVAGALFLGLAVLVIDEVIARTTAARWHKVARNPVTRLAATKDAMDLKQLGAALNDKDWATAARTPELVRSCVGLLDRTVISARALTPLLTASDDLLEVYARVSDVADKAERLSRYGSHYLAALQARGGSTPRRAPAAGVEPRFYEASVRLKREQNDFIAALAALDEVAHRVLGAGAADAHPPDSPLALQPRAPKARRG